MASLHDPALNLMRLIGFSDISTTTRRHAHYPYRAELWRGRAASGGEGDLPE
jgi:hypothetical protein